MGDTPLWLELSNVSQLHYMDQSMATRFFLPESMTQSQDGDKVRRFWLSNAEMCLYMAEKHNLPRKDIESFRHKLGRSELYLAFDEQDKALGRLAKQHLQNLNLRETLYYWGTRNRMLNRILKIGQRLRKGIKIH